MQIDVDSILLFLLHMFWILNLIYGNLFSSQAIYKKLAGTLTRIRATKSIECPSNNVIRTELVISF